jgi:hypothetical protein
MNEFKQLIEYIKRTKDNAEHMQRQHSQGAASGVLVEYNERFALAHEFQVLVLESVLAQAEVLKVQMEHKQL